MGIFDKKKRMPKQLKMLPISLIDPNPMQPRKNFEAEPLEQLAQSIRENGLLTPISVRKCGDRYQLIAGERRLLAVKLIGQTEIAAIIEDINDTQSAQLAIIENLQRRDLNFYEEAVAIDRLINSCELTQQQAAQRLGLSQSAVANKLRLLKLPQRAVEAMVKANLSERHARAMLPLAGDSRLDTAVKRVIEYQLNVAQTEKLAASLTAEKKSAPRGERKLIIKDLRIFNTTIARAVDLMKQAGIDAVSQKTEDEQNIVYTVVIPKKKNENRSQTPSIKAF